MNRKKYILHFFFQCAVVKDVIHIFLALITSWILHFFFIVAFVVAVIQYSLVIYSLSLLDTLYMRWMILVLAVRYAVKWIAEQKNEWTDNKRMSLYLWMWMLYYPIHHHHHHCLWFWFYEKKRNKINFIFFTWFRCTATDFALFRSFLFSINVLGIDRDLSNSVHFTNCTKFHIGHFVALLAIRTFARYFARIGCVWVFISRRSQNRTNYTDTYLNGSGISHFRAKINMLNNGCNEIDTTIAWDACKCNRCAARQTWVIV